MTLEQALDANLDSAATYPEKAADFFNTLSIEQPGIFTFLFDSDTQLLSEEEHDYLLFLAMVIVESAKSADITIEEDVDVDTLEDMAEHNWGLIEHVGMDVITDSLAEHPGFPLYAFLEDCCILDEDGTHELLSAPASELLFVKGKAVIDSLFLQEE
jgi:hypothetical protein